MHYYSIVRYGILSFAIAFAFSQSCRAVQKDPKSAAVQSTNGADTEQAVAAGDKLKFDEKFEHWPAELKIKGQILVDTGIEDFEPLERLIDAIVEQEKIVYLTDDSSDDENEPPLLAAVRERVGDKDDLAVKSAADAFESDLKTALAGANVVAIQRRDVTANKLIKLKSEFNSFIDRRGVLIVNATVGQMLGKFSIAAEQSINDGLNLIPDCLLNSDYDGSEESEQDFLNQLATQPKTIGIGLAPKTMLVFSGRKFACYGANAKASFLLPSREHLPKRVTTITPQNGRRRVNPRSFLADLPEWRVDAIDRTLPKFPAEQPDKPYVGNGTLVIVGGGGMPRGLIRQFVELAGGKDNAKLVAIPCSESENVDAPRMVAIWKRQGVKNAAFIHTKDRRQANTNEEFLEPLKDATGVWFGGGRQWNFSDSYYGTQAHKLMKQVLDRGGVIGGSSAGASIQARYMARGTPIGNSRIMAGGYARGGLGFISGVAIDQHFTQRSRHKDMSLLVDTFPQLLGIGIDEATALIVKKSKADVIGRGAAFFFDRSGGEKLADEDYITVKSGNSYDLAKRKMIDDAEQAEDGP